MEEVVEPIISDSKMKIVPEQKITDWRELPPDSVCQIDLSGQGFTELSNLTMYPNLKCLDLSSDQLK